MSDTANISPASGGREAINEQQQFSESQSQMSYLKDEKKQINDYLNQFKYLKTDIDELFKTKNPISFVFGIKKIFAKINDYLKEISKFINKSLGTYSKEGKAQSRAFLHDLWLDISYYEKVKSINNNSYVLKKLKFYNPEKYFEIYSRYDTNFKPFIQKIIKIINTNKFDLSTIEATIHANPTFQNYQSIKDVVTLVFGQSNFQDYIYDEKNNPDWLKMGNGYSSESGFMGSLISYFFNQDGIDDDTKEAFLKKMYGVFSLGDFYQNQLNYSKSIEVENILWFEDINDIKNKHIAELKQTKALEELLKHYTFSYRNYVEVSNIIDSYRGEWKIRGYLWGYFKNKVHKQISPAWNVFSLTTKEKILDKQTWLELRLDYESNFENIHEDSSSKNQSIEFMNTISEYKNLIVRLQDSVFADLIKLHILGFLKDNLTVKSENLDFIKFLLYFASSQNYYEYVKVYTFFYEYDAFERNERQKIFKIALFNNILWGSIIIIFGFLVSAILLFWVILYLTGKVLYKKNLYSQNTYVRWHNGLRFAGVLVIFFFGLNVLTSNHYLSFDINVGGKSINIQRLISDDIYNYMFYSVNDMVEDTKPYVDILLNHLK